MTNPSPNDVETVEDCLCELREIFPGWKYFAITDSIGAPRQRYRIKLGPSFYSATVRDVWGETLGDCMAQVRLWKQERESNGRT